jgi:hypothetical protein
MQDDAPYVIRTGSSIQPVKSLMAVHTVCCHCAQSPAIGLGPVGINWLHEHEPAANVVFLRLTAPHAAEALNLFMSVVQPAVSACALGGAALLTII